MTSGRINYCLGAWLILAAILNFSEGWIVLNNLLVGIIAAIIGCSMIKNNFYQGWLTVILGYWLFMSIFSAGLVTIDVIFWNSLIVGTLIIIAGLGSVDKKSSEPKKYHIHLN